MIHLTPEQPKIILLVGMIASGKSTACKKFAEAGAVIICDDEIIKMVHGGNYTLYDKSLKRLYKSIETHIATSALLLGKTVVVDRGVNLKKNSRSRWIGLANSFDVPCDAIIFPFASREEHAARRFNSDSRGLSYEYWLKITGYHQNQYVEPTKEEGLTEIVKFNGDFK